MRLLHLIQSAKPSTGGVIEAVNQLSVALLGQGHRVEVASLDAPGELPESKNAFPIHPMGAGRSGYGFASNFAPWLRKACGDYDAVIVNGLWQHVGLAARSACVGARTPYYVFPHGMLDPWFRKNYPYKHLKKIIYWRLFERRVLRDAQSVLYTCREEMLRAPLSFGREKFSEAIVPLGVRSPPEMRERQLAAFRKCVPMSEGKRIILFLGRLHEKKGCDLLIKAFSNTMRGVGAGAEQCHLVIAGPESDPAYVKSLLTLAADGIAGSGMSMSWTGMLSGDEKWGAFRAADAFVLPSHQENFGLAVVEALSCGTPVLISDKVNIWREIIEDGAGIVESDDIEGVERLLHKWLALPSEGRAKMSRAARECFISRFEISRSVQKLIGVIEASALPNIGS